MKKYSIVVTVTLLFAISFWTNPQSTYAQSSKSSHICVNVYDDANGSATLDTGEKSVAGAFVQIYDSSNHKVARYTTAGVSDPLCTAVEFGRYRVEVNPPDDYKEVTRMDWEFQLEDGSTVTLDFGVISFSSTAIGPELVRPQTSFPDNTPAQVCSVVYLDSDLDGNRDADEVLVSGATIELQDVAGTWLVMHKTGGPGDLECVSSWPNRYYRILMTAPLRYRSTTGAAWEFWLLSNSTANLEFGVTPNLDSDNKLVASLCVSVFIDLDKNGLKDAKDRLVRYTGLEIRSREGQYLNKATWKGIHAVDCFTVPANETLMLNATPPFGYALENQSAYEKFLAPNEVVIFDIALVPESSTASPSFASVAPFFLAFLPLVILALIETIKQRRNNET